MLVKAMKQSRAPIGQALTDHGLHPGQDLLLSALWREDGITQTELTERLGIEAPTVSKALTRLEKVGYIRREAGRGRSRRVYLTEAGQALRQPVEQAWADADELLTERVGQADVETLRELLRRVARR